MADGPNDAETLSVREDDPGHAIVQKFWLLVVAGPDMGATYTSNGERTVIGTYDGVDLVLKDSTVSRFHCEITPAAGRDRVQLRDLGSLNGTSVNGVQVVSAFLHGGATITMGRTQIRFDVGGEQINIPVSQRARFGIMVGKSLPMRRSFALLERAAATESTVLLEGETGTGKEVAAESIHRESGRAKGPFVVVDCSAIPGDLLESELFGHEKGAFTGAVAAREGAFEAAQGGTIFLDEIGELPLELQPKLLRVLERKEVKRVGATRYSPVDVRVIAATNRNLRAEVNAKKFRSDLYYRLAVLEARLPPLRERLDDLGLLVDEIVEKGGARAGAGAELMSVKSKEFLAHLAGHTWPGNVRELRNYLDRVIALRERPPLEGDGPAASGGGDAPPVDVTQPLKVARDAYIRSYERRYAEGLLARNANNVTAAARAAGVDRIHFYRLLWRHGLR